MSHAVVRKLLEGRLATWAATQSLAVAWQNVHASPTPPYLRAFLLPAETQSDDLEGKHRAYRGIFQINIVAVVGDGPGAAETTGAALEALFPNNLVLTSGAIRMQTITPMSYGPPISDSDTYTQPMFCQYRCDVI